MLDTNDKKANLPDFLIVGAAKSGTTSLFYYLNKHPMIFMPVTKEPNFFSYMDNPPNYKSPARMKVISNYDDYTNLFDSANDKQLIGEASPSYLFASERTIENIKTIYGTNYKKIKIIIILRNPVEVAFSMYSHHLRGGTESLDFESSIAPETVKDRQARGWNIFYDYLSVGMYHDRIKNYLETFPLTKVLLFDDLVNDPNKLVNTVHAFFGIEELALKDKTVYNKSGEPKIKFLNSIVSGKIPWLIFPLKLLKNLLPAQVTIKLLYIIRDLNMEKVEIPERTREILMSHFRDDIDKVQHLINRDLSQWKGDSV